MRLESIATQDQNISITCTNQSVHSTQGSYLRLVQIHGEDRDVWYRGWPCFKRGHHSTLTGFISSGHTLINHKVSAKNSHLKHDTEPHIPTDHTAPLSYTVLLIFMSLYYLAHFSRGYFHGMCRWCGTMELSVKVSIPCFTWLKALQFL